jgi:hypothetical protein
MPALPVMGERAACCPSVGRPRKGHINWNSSATTHSLMIGGEMQSGGAHRA